MHYYLVILLVFSTLAILLHSFTLALLFKIKVQNLKDSQKYLMIALCIVELALSVDSITLALLNILDIKHFINQFLKCFNYTLLYPMYNFTMALITLDRLLEFKLNIKYPLYFSPKMTLLAIITLLIASLIVFVYVFVSDMLNPWNYPAFFLVYVHVPVEGLNLILASFTYYTIFQKIKSNRTKRRETRRVVNDKTQSETIFRIFVPSFIILTYILFNLIPSIILTLEPYYFPGQGTIIMYIIILLYSLGWLSDPLVYIFSLKSVRMKLRRLYLEYLRGINNMWCFARFGIICTI